MVCEHVFTIASSSNVILTGTGAVYSFDPVGSYEREACRAAGAAQSLVQPFLDNQVRLYKSPSMSLHTRTPDAPPSARETELFPNLYHL